MLYYYYYKVIITVILLFPYFIGPAVRFRSFEIGEPTHPPLIGQRTIQVLRDTRSDSDTVISMLLESGTVAQNEVQ